MVMYNIVLPFLAWRIKHRVISGSRWGGLMRTPRGRSIAFDRRGRCTECRPILSTMVRELGAEATDPFEIPERGPPGNRSNDLTMCLIALS